MTNGAPYKVCWFVNVGRGFPGVLLRSWVVRWMMPGTVLGDVATSRQLCLAATPSHVGVDVDGLDCSLHSPMAYNRQTRGHGFLSGVALSHHAAVGSGTFLGDVWPLGLDICWSVDSLSTCLTEYYMEKPTFTGAFLSCVRDIMAIMHVPLVESVCQTVMGRIPVHEYMLSSACGLLWPRPIVTGTKCDLFP
jgi:hypothetical protein